MRLRDRYKIISAKIPAHPQLMLNRPLAQGPKLPSRHRLLFIIHLHHSSPNIRLNSKLPVSHYGIAIWLGKNNVNCGKKYKAYTITSSIAMNGKMLTIIRVSGISEIAETVTRLSPAGGWICAIS